MRKKKVSVFRKIGVIAGTVCLCLLVGAAIFQSNGGGQSDEARQKHPAETADSEDKKEQSAETADPEDKKGQSAETAGSEDKKERRSASSDQKDFGEQEDAKPDGSSTGAVSAEAQNSNPQEKTDSGRKPESSAAEAQSSQVLELPDIQAMSAGDILDASALSREFLDSLFYSQEISEDLRQRIWGNSYQENNHISLSELRYLRVLHVGFDEETHIGELIVNQSIAEDILEIMSELYRQNYPIERMLLIDEYGADDESSMSDNNTSAFNYREIAGSSKLSRHALGLAIDINPRYNPYVKQKDAGEVLVSPANGGAYADRSQEFPHKITEGDLCLQLFSEHGFTWGGYWNSVKDYQHFEK